ncbi:MAG: GntR family transcriptional regulator [Burkholderiaceae bacterium]
MSAARLPTARSAAPSRRRAKPKTAARPAPAPRGKAGAGGAERSDTTTQRIVDSITTAVVERRLMPGTKLAEQKLADIFDCSRTLVRQALNQLSRDRLVTLDPGRGAFVATPGVAEARQVFEARQMIEGAMVRHLCSCITDAQLAELRAHLGAERAAIARTDIAGRTRLLADFHVVLARMMGNDVLAQLLADLLTRSSLIALMYQSTHSAEASLAEHVAIVDALARRDARAAAKLTHEHLTSVETNLRLHPRTPDLVQALQAP